MSDNTWFISCAAINNESDDTIPIIAQNSNSQNESQKSNNSIVICELLLRYFHGTLND
ncbi:MAG: hypothetical protein AAFR37_16900 [Cyanobacteria bacterium J06628_3]